MLLRTGIHSCHLSSPVLAPGCPQGYSDLRSSPLVWGSAWGPGAGAGRLPVEVCQPPGCQNAGLTDVSWPRRERPSSAAEKKAIKGKGVGQSRPHFFRFLLRNSRMSALCVPKTGARGGADRKGDRVSGGERRALQGVKAGPPHCAQKSRKPWR